jgi:predicted RNA methylase
LTKEGNKRVTGKEQYYTPSSLASDLVAKTMVELAGTLDINPNKATWVEPAGGTGNFIVAAQIAGITKIKSWDIEPKSAGIVKGNFLEQDLSKLARPLIVYGNPPFGRNNSLAVKFFNHASEHADVIAFLVPRSWRKWSVHNKLDKRFELVSDIDVSVNFVDEGEAEINGGKSTLKTCYQVWKRLSSTVLRKPVEVEDRGYIKKVGFEDADVSMTVFGHGCGKVKRDFPRVSNSTQMFLQAEEYVIRALEKIDFSEFYERTAYVEALSIKEIMYCLNRHFDS